MDDLQKLDSLLNWRKKYNFSFNFRELSKEENVFWYNKITKNYTACGCNTGKIFTLISLLLIFLYYFIQYKQNDLIPSNSFYLLSFFFIVFFALLGKIVGKVIAYKKLNIDIIKLKKIIENRRI